MKKQLLVTVALALGIAFFGLNSAFSQVQPPDKNQNPTNPPPPDQPQQTDPNKPNQQVDPYRPNQSIDPDRPNQHSDPDQHRLNQPNPTQGNQPTGTTKPQTGQRQMPNTSSWNQSAQTAITDIKSKYGEPDEMTESMLIWHDKGPWKEIHVYKEAIAHDFPAPHMDVLKTVINYKVPPEKIDDLVLFDGSLIVNRTKGTLSAVCDSEAMNYLALNLAHDIIKNARTWREARQFLAQTAMAYKNGDRSSAYTKKIGFGTMSNTMDRDMKITFGNKSKLTSEKAKMQPKQNQSQDQ